MLALISSIQRPTPTEGGQWTAWFSCRSYVRMTLRCGTAPPSQSSPLGSVLVRRTSEGSGWLQRMPSQALPLKSPASLQCPFCEKWGYNLVICGQASAYPGLTDVCVVTHAVEGGGGGEGGEGGGEEVCEHSRAHLGACVPLLDAFSPKTFPPSDRNNLLANLHNAKPYRDFLGNLGGPDTNDKHFIFSLLAAALHGKKRMRELKLNPGFVADYVSKSSTLLARILLPEGSERRMIADQATKIWNTEHRQHDVMSVNEKASITWKM